MSGRLQRGAGRVIGSFLSVILAVTGVSLVVMAPAARADTAPPDPATPETVSADALPTVQINGIVWAQAVVGNTVYVTGSFTSARPAGSPAGTNETPRGNLLAYDITTGNLIQGFNHTLNAQGRAIAASPDGSRVYVAGDFTAVNGQARNRIVAFNTADGSLIGGWNGGAAASVRTLTATNSVLYAGGIYAQAMGNNRSGLSAYSAATGALLNWAPEVTGGQVDAMVVTPDQSRVIVGGKFNALNGVQARGLGAIDANTGATVPWAANQLIQNYGDTSGISSLRTDGTNIYGSGWVFGGTGNLEGSFAASPNSGELIWVEDCHGDTYDSFAAGGVFYNVGHAHHCGNVGGFPETSPRSFNRALAWTVAPTGTVLHNSTGNYFDFFGNPAPSPLTWYPRLAAGNVSGQTQAAWSITGNSSYLSLGGEFPTVNGTAQQGLVRFAIKTIAPNKVAPQYSAASLTPTALPVGDGTARVTWTTTFDYDNEALTYKVVRDGNTANPVYTTTVNGNFWQTKQIGFYDTGLQPGSTHTYRVYVSDPLNNTIPGPTGAPVTISADAPSAYSQLVKSDGAANYWRLGEPSGTVGYDWAGFSDLTVNTGATRGAAGAVTGDVNTATTFNGSTSGFATTTGTAVPAPNTFTAEAWIKTTSTSGGKILGYGNRNTGTSSSYDRHVYMTNNGRVVFGVYNGAARTVASTQSFNDGQWHHVAASLSEAGMALYVDGKRVGRDTSVTSGSVYSGYWRVGGDNLGSWPDRPTSAFLSGSVDEAAIYPTALTLAQLQQHYLAAGRTLNIPPPPTDAYGSVVYNAGPDIYWRLDETAGPTATDASGNIATGNYTGGVTYQAPSSVLGTNGTGVTFNGSNGLLASGSTVANPTVYSEELWFRTTSTSGGKLIGFGNNATGNSGSYDRHVWMRSNGRVSFGVYTGSRVIITSSQSYNDGQWHHVVATQGSSGIKLYLDGAEVAANAETRAQNFTGYWRVGGDVVWEGASTNYFAGSIDEVAIYGRQLTAAEVTEHHAIGTGRNLKPTASFTASCTYLTCAFDAAESSDPDGTIAAYNWDFGDGTTGAGVSGSHDYTAAGERTVTLTVVDDKGGTATTTRTVSPTEAPANGAPTASFTVDCTALTCAFNASASTDPDGVIAGYAWDFGNGTTGSGVSGSQTYGAAGDYTVTLTVVDDRGATATATQAIAPRPADNPTAGPYAVDTFNRTVTGNSWGSADVGGAWTNVNGVGPRSVAPGVGSLTMASATSQTGVYLGGVSATDSDVTTTVTLDKAATGNGVYIYVAGRRISTNNEYRARLRVLSNNSVQLALTALAGSSTETTLVGETPLAGVTFTPGLQLKVRFQVIGTSPTTLRLKVWPAGSAEPATWQRTGTDSSAALQAPGSVGLTGYVSGSATNAPFVVQATDFRVDRAAGAPTADFATSCADLTCAVDGSTSTDPNNAIASYAWSWGDGTVTTGATSQHAFAAAGTYRITLTVTNAFGWTNVTTRTVTVP